MLNTRTKFKSSLQLHWSSTNCVGLLMVRKRIARMQKKRLNGAVKN